VLSDSQNAFLLTLCILDLGVDLFGLLEEISLILKFVKLLLELIEFSMSG